MIFFVRRTLQESGVFDHTCHVVGDPLKTKGLGCSAERKLRALQYFEREQKRNPPQETDGDQSSSCGMRARDSTSPVTSTRGVAHLARCVELTMGCSRAAFL